MSIARRNILRLPEFFDIFLYPCHYKFFLSLVCLNPLRILIQALIHAIWGRFYFAIFPLSVYIM